MAVDPLEAGGRMIIPVGSSRSQSWYLLEKKCGMVRQNAAPQVRFVPMTRQAEEPLP